MNKTKTGKYQHFKGNFYQVLGVVLHTETNEKMVLYQALYDCPDLKKEYGKNPLFVRPFKNFFEKKMINGKEVERFKLVE